MARILVTGGAGFIGSHLVDALITRGHRVTVIDNLFSGRRSNVNPRARLMVMDIRSPRLIPRVRQLRPKIIFHLAAQMNVRASIDDPIFDARVNILGSINLIQAAVAAGTKRFIFSSSGGAIYGEQPTLPIPETARPQPEAPYGIAKYSVEHYLEFFSRSHGLSAISLRYANVYGPRQNPKGEAGVVAIFSEHLKHQQPITIFGDGRQTRDYIYVQDVVRANLAAMRSKFVGALNIGTGRETSVNHLVRMIMQSAGKTTRIVHRPPITGELLRNAVNPTRAKKSIHWQPKVALTTGLHLTLPSFGLKHG